MGNQSNCIGALGSAQRNNDVLDLLGKTTAIAGKRGLHLRLQAERAKLPDHRVSQTCVVETSRRMGHAGPNDLLQQSADSSGRKLVSRRVGPPGIGWHASQQRQ